MLLLNERKDNWVYKGTVKGAKTKQYSAMQYNSFYFNTMTIKALPLMGSCI